MGLTESILLVSCSYKAFFNNLEERIEENNNYLKRNLNNLRTKRKNRKKEVKKDRARYNQTKKHETIYKYNTNPSEMADEFVKTPTLKSIPELNYEIPIITEFSIKDTDLTPAVNDKTYVHNSFHEERVNPTALSCSTNGKNLIKASEGCVLETYRCQAGVLTIGYGHTSLVNEGDKITKETAEKYLDEDIRAVENFIRNNVTVPLTQNEFDALVSFGYNIGNEKLNNSTLLKKLNDGDYQGAAEEFSRWNKVNKNGTFVVSQGLTTRREREKELFLS